MFDKKDQMPVQIEGNYEIWTLLQILVINNKCFCPICKKTKQRRRSLWLRKSCLTFN